MEIIIEYGWIIFSSLILIWFILHWENFSDSVKENPFGDYEEPRTAATLGVLFTFLGIAAGLFNFDATDIQKSVQELLGGMKTAFVTSIIGMVISLFLKSYQSNTQKNSKQISKSEKNISDLIQYLQKSDAEKNNLLNGFKTYLLRKGEYTVVGQMKLIRFDMNEKFKSVENILQENNKQMLNAFENFAEKLAENNSKIFIEVLNETMKDFNNKLTEQFGENFKQLNIAVGRLLEWQENYKSTLERVAENLQLTFESIETVKNSFTEIEKSANSMTESSKQIQKLIVAANFYETELEKILQEIQTLCENANESFKNLAEKIQSTLIKTNNMTASINSFGNTTLSKISNATAETITSMQKMAVEFRNESFKITSETAEKMNEMMLANDKNFQESLETLGKAMLQISKKFAQDYEPLANELKKIVEISKQVKQLGKGGLF